MIVIVLFDQWNVAITGPVLLVVFFRRIDYLRSLLGIQWNG